MSQNAKTYKFEDAPEEKRLTGCAALGEFIWNGKKGEFCGRSGASWGKYLLSSYFFLKILFYLIIHKFNF